MRKKLKRTYSVADLKDLNQEEQEPLTKRQITIAEIQENIMNRLEKIVQPLKKENKRLEMDNQRLIRTINSLFFQNDELRRKLQSLQKQPSDVTISPPHTPRANRLWDQNQDIQNDKEEEVENLLESCEKIKKTAPNSPSNK